MLKYLVSAFLAVVIGTPILASYFLPWWGTLLVVVGEIALLVGSAPKLGKFVMVQFAKGLFGIKSKVLRKAKVEVHACEETTKPASKDEPSDPDLTQDVAGYVLVDCTITPNPRHEGPMQHWDPWDFTLAPYGKRMGMQSLDEEGLEDEGDLVAVTVVGPDGAERDEAYKTAGPMRLRMVFACPATLTGRAKLRYYFEGIGDIRLP